MKLVALTGGIGSGKTTVAEIFKILGIPVYHADSEARYLMESNSDLKNLLIHKFGPQAYDQDHKLNAPYISNIVFNNSIELEWLNKTVHPFVGEHLKNWSLQSGVEYGIMETALLKESMQLAHFYKIIYVSAKQSQRISRIEKRDRQHAEAILKKIRFQEQEGKLSKLADFTIFNDGSASLVKQVLEIHQSIHLGLSQ